MFPSTTAPLLRPAWLLVLFRTHCTSMRGLNSCNHSKSCPCDRARHRGVTGAYSDALWNCETTDGEADGRDVTGRAAGSAAFLACMLRNGEI